MRKLSFALTLVLIFVAAGCGGGSTSSAPPPPPPPPTDPDQAADLLVSQMTQDEKLQLAHGELTIENPAGPRAAEEYVPGIARLKTPDLLYGDGPNGVYSSLDRQRRSLHPWQARQAGI